MDFFTLLKNKPKTYDNIEPPKIEHPIIEIRLTDKKIVDECKIEDDHNEKTIINGRGIVSKKKNDTPLFNLEEVQFRKGDPIKVVRLENSILNQYKGYNGIIREYQKNNDSCMVTLEALNSGAPIRFPKKHLIKWCPYTNTEL
jgi:hypothetical protein